MSRAKQRLRGKGILVNEVSPSRMMMVPHTDLKIALKGHPLYDPRSADPVDEALAADFVSRVNAGDCPNTDAILVWEKPDGLLVGDGHQRTNSLGRASELLGGRVLMVLVEFFDGDEKAFLLERARRNDHGRFAKLDKPSTLAFRVKQLSAVGATEREIADACGRGIGPAEVAALARWGSLAAEAKARFDGGAPIGLLAAVLEQERCDQIAALDKLLAAGVRSARGATRRTNAERASRDPWARRMSPRFCAALGEGLAPFITSNPGVREAPVVAAKHIRMGVALGLKLAVVTGREAEEVLATLPPDLAATIREARAAKATKARAK